MSTIEPIYQTIPRQFFGATNYDRQEQDFLATLCFYLGVKNVDRDNIDTMKEAVNNYILNQVDDWMKEKDSVIIEGILDGNFKRLCEAQTFLRNREGTPQIHWLNVIENHVKLIASYSHILNTPRRWHG